PPTPLLPGWPFFFQAEDGIRDFHVTGVQTCALPIFDKSDSNIRNAFLEHVRGHRVFIFTCLLGPGITRMVQLAALQVCEMPGARSEERRVGKERSSRGPSGPIQDGARKAVAAAQAER